MSLISCIRPINILINQNAITKRCLHIGTVLNKAGHYRPKTKVKQPLTYEMANPPYQICARKSWNSWNTSNLKDGNRKPETLIEDIFIRNFMQGTWHNLFLSEVIIKRQHNMIRIAGIIVRRLHPTKIYFLIGYSEQLLSYWLHCPVKLELVTVATREDVIYKVI